MVSGAEAGSWIGLLPSTPIRVHGRLVPGRDGRALLLVRSTPERIGVPAAHQRFAGRLRADLRAACADLPPAARGLLPGLVVGDTSMLPADLEADFRTTELTHLTAVSGTNITILLGFVLLVLRRSGVRGRALPITGAVAVACFVVVARPEPSVLRAAVMGLVTVVALYTGRPRRGLPALSVAVLGLVLFDPTLARSYGFALSVLATGALLLLAPHWAARLCARGWPKWAAVMVAVPLAAQAVCGPLVVTFAGRVGLMAVPCNLLAEFAVAPATILGFVALLPAPVCLPLAQSAAWLGSWPIRWIVMVAHTGAALPGAAVTWPTGVFGGVVLAAITVAAVPTLRVLRRPRSARPTGWPRVMTAALLATLAVVLLLRPPAVVRPLTGWPPPNWHLVMCDVGQGDAIVLNAGPGTGILIDAGPDPHAVDRCLRDLGIRRLPLILLSHFHADHVEGLPGALRGRAVGLIQGTSVLEPMAEVIRVRRWAAAAGIPLSTPTDGERRTRAALTWQTLTPPPNTPRPRPTPGTATRPNSPLSDTRSLSPPPASGPTPAPPPNPPATRAEGPVRGSASSPSDVPVGPDVREWAAAAPSLPVGSVVGGSVANNASLVVLAERHGVRMLLTGDAETEAQEVLRARLAGVRVDVLKVAHHGSARQDPGLVLGLHPRLALVSVGKGNPYGHPSPSARALVAATGARLLRTDTDGPIAVTGSPTHLNAVARGPDTATRADHPPAPIPAPVQVIASAQPWPSAPAGTRAGRLPRGFGSGRCRGPATRPHARGGSGRRVRPVTAARPRRLPRGFGSGRCRRPVTRPHARRGAGRRSSSATAAYPAGTVPVASRPGRLVRGFAPLGTAGRSPALHARSGAGRWLHPDTAARLRRHPRRSPPARIRPRSAAATAHCLGARAVHGMRRMPPVWVPFGARVAASWGDRVRVAHCGAAHRLGQVLLFLSRWTATRSASSAHVWPTA
ncbi:ComEC/Rec2 family competence protein [Embleya sp. NPDC050493]|uniref:ComEC/Rec2 family competence protein n=1 Tax=Embleya sp. NPDC050493 TaxID=3363989 RepID=UPI0037B1453E